MFQANEAQSLKELATVSEANYIISKNDLLQIEVYTNNGEQLIDPNRESFQQGPSTSVANSAELVPTYLVDIKGMVKFPKLEPIRLEGLSVRQAEAILQQELTKDFVEPYVVIRVSNKRVIVLGAGGGQVIPLPNDNSRLTEVLALAKGVSGDAKAHNIRVLRGEKLFIADFSTFEGYVKNNLIIQPGDVVYVEPVRRPFLEALREYGSLLTILTSVGTLVFVIYQANN